MLELINRARHNPTQEGIILDSINTWYSRDARIRKPSFFTNLRQEFASYPAVPPLAFLPSLLQAADAHSQDMIARNYFAHVNPEGQGPTDRAAEFGFDSGVGENLSGGGATNAATVIQHHYGLMVDYDNIDLAHPLGHRYNVLDGAYTEAGIGIAGPYAGGKITQDFGARSKAYILGVAYNDANSNGTYDPGEGLAGITVTPSTGNWYAETSASGGFAIPIDPVETVTDSVNLPFPVSTTPWSQVEPHDTAYRQQKMQAATPLAVTLTWSGGALTSSKTTVVTIKRPVLINYNLIGTDNYYYPLSMVTAQNKKADLRRNAPDFDDNWKPDLVLQNTVTGASRVWYMNGAIRSGLAALPGIPTGWQIVGTGDFNRDGKPDLVLQNTTTKAGTVWYMNGASYVSGAGVAGIPAGWQIAGAADFNGDGKPDLVLQDEVTSAGRIWYMNGATYSSAANMTAIPTGWRIAAIGDFSSDGQPDLVLQNGATGAGRIWYMSGPSRKGSAILPTIPADWQIVGAGDFNTDGKSDLIFQITTTGAGRLWYFDGATRIGNASIGGLSTDWQIKN